MADAIERTPGRIFTLVKNGKPDVEEMFAYIQHLETELDQFRKDLHAALARVGMEVSLRSSQHG